MVQVGRRSQLAWIHKRGERLEAIIKDDRRKRGSIGARVYITLLGEIRNGDKVPKLVWYLRAVGVMWRRRWETLLHSSHAAWLTAWWGGSIEARS